jgi:Aldehyde oxidase and xanthine dehydrogenase, a/b hammerhead domain
MRFGIGQPVTRKEDHRFLTGRGRYVADIDLVRQAYAVFVFSPHAHARIRGVDKAAAERMPDVFAVLTGEDWAADGLGTLEPEVMAEEMGGPKGYRTKRPPLAQDRVRYVGERVAVVIAATEARARDAAELVAVDYDVLPAVVRPTMRSARALRSCTRVPPTTPPSRCAWAMPTRPMPPSPAHITSRGYRSTTTASPPSQWSRAAASVSLIQERAVTPSTAARKTCTASARSWRIRSCVSRKAASASSPAMSVAALA